MELGTKEIVDRFVAIAVELGVPPEKGELAGRQFFNSMVRMTEKGEKASDRERKKLRLEVLKRPPTEFALVEWLGTLTAAARDGVIKNNVRPYVPLYQDHEIEPEPKMDKPMGVTEQAIVAQKREPLVPLEGTIRRMKLEIIADVLAGHVPLDCASFSALHDFRDANAYGGFCEDSYAEQLIGHYGGRDEHEGMPDGMLAYIDEAQDAINRWLVDGGLASDCPPPGWSVIDAGLDDPLNRSGNKPFDSMYEKRIGGNGYPTCDLTVMIEGEKYCPAHGNIVMPDRVGSAKAAAEIAMTWAVENGWSNDELRDSIAPGAAIGRVPVPAFSPFLDHAEHAKAVAHASVLRDAPNLVASGMWSGKVLDVEHGVVIQKINRAGNTVQHDTTKLSTVVKVGDVVDIQYANGVGIVSGLGQSMGVSR